MAVGSITGGISNTLVSIGVNTREWFAGLDKAQKKWVKFGAQLQVTGFRMMTVWGATFGALGAATAKFGASFEKEFVGVRKTVDGTDKEFSKLKETLLSTAKATGMSADQLAILARKGGQLGVATEDLGKFTSTLAKLSIAAAELDPDEAATGLARMMNITGTSLKDIDIVASVLADLGDKFATTEDRILNFSQRISGLGKVANISATDIMGLGAAFTATVPGVELVATQMSKAMGIFANAVKSGGTELETLNTVVGGDFKQMFEKDAAGAIAKFLEGLDRIDTSGGNVYQVLRDLHLTNQRAAQAFLSAAKNSGQFTKALEVARKETDLARTAQGKLNKVFKEQMETVGAKWGQVWERIRTVFIRVFDAFADEIKWFLDTAMTLLGWAEDFAKGLAWIPKPISIIALGLIGLAGAAAVTVTGLGMFASVLGTILPTLTAIKTAIIAFSGATAAADVPLTAWAIKAKVAGTSTATFGAIAQGTAAKLWLLLKPVLAVAAAFTAGWYAGKGMRWIIDTYFPNFSKWLDDLTVKMAKFLGIMQDEAEDQEQIQRGREQAIGQILRLTAATGDHITRLDLLGKSENELNEIRAKQISKFRETEVGMKDLNDIMLTSSERAAVFAETLGEQLLATQKLKEEEALLNKASELYGDTITDVAEAQQIVNKAIAMGIIPAQQYANALKSVADTGLKPFLGSDIAKQLALGAGGLGMPNVTGLVSSGSDWLAEAQNPFSSIHNLAGDVHNDINIITEDLHLLPNAADGAKDAMSRFNKVLSQANKVGRLVGGTFGKIVSATMGAAGGLTSIMNAGKTSAAAGGSGGFLGGIGSMFDSARKEAGGGIMGAISGGLAVAGPIAAIAGPIIKGLTKLFTKDPRWKDIAKQSASIFGQTFSEELAKKIETSEASGLGFGEALAQNIGSIAEEVGVSAENLDQIWGHFFLGIDSGVASTEELGKAFGKLTEHLQTLGTEGYLQIGQMVRAMLEAGVASQELKDHLSSMLGEIQSSMEPALGWIATLEDLTAEEAENLSGVIVAAWGAAIAQTGSFIQAVGQLGESFTNALAVIQEALGEDGSALINPIVEITNVIKNSEGALPALASIASGLDAMAQSGILTADALMSMGNAIKTSFDKAVEATGNETAALKAAWPELVKLYDYFEKMGMEVPGWLQEMIDGGKEMGLSMQMPLGTNEALNAILEVLLKIAGALGAVASEAESATSAIGGIPEPGGGGPRGKGRPADINAQVGWQGDVLSPAKISVAESGPEHVAISPQGPGQESSGVDTFILQVDGVTLGKIISEGSKTGKVRIHRTAVREF